MRPAVMVMPERETPGASASAWATPTTSPSCSESSCAGRTAGRRSTSQRTPANTASRIAICHGSPRCSVIASSNARPTTAAGIVATTTIHARRSSGVSSSTRPERPEERTHHRHEVMRRSTPRRRTSVPRWSATSNVLLNRVVLQVRPVAEPRDEHEVARGRDREQLRRALDHPEDERLPVGEAGRVPHASDREERRHRKQRRGERCTSVCRAPRHPSGATAHRALTEPAKETAQIAKFSATTTLTSPSPAHRFPRAPSTERD